MESIVINGETGELIELSSDESNYFTKEGNLICINNIINYENIDDEYFEISCYRGIFIIRNNNIEDFSLNNMKIGYNKVLTLEDMDIISNIYFSLTFKSNSTENSQLGFSRLGLLEDKCKGYDSVIKDIESYSDTCFEHKLLESNTELLNNINQLAIEYETKDFASYVLEILKRNQIESFIPYEILTFETKVRFYYNVEGMISLFEYIKSIDFKNNQSTIILFNIIIKIEMLEEYLLNYSYLDLDIKNIFICKESLNIKFVLSSNLHKNKNIYISLIKIIEIINGVKPNNYLNFEKSNFQDYLAKENLGLNMLGRLLLDEERQNRIDDEILNQSIGIDATNSINNPIEKPDVDKSIKEKSRTVSEKIIIALNKHNKNFKMGIALQCLLLIAVSIIYLTNYLKTMDFIALLIILGALDLWILKYTKIILK